MLQPLSYAFSEHSLTVESLKGRVFRSSKQAVRNQRTADLNILTIRDRDPGSPKSQLPREFDGYEMGRGVLTYKRDHGSVGVWVLRKQQEQGNRTIIPKVYDIDP